MAFSPDGDTLAAGSTHGQGFVPFGTFRLLGVPGLNVREIKSFDKSTAVWAVAYSLDGKQVASGGMLPGIMMWNPQDGRLLKTIVGPLGQVRCLAFSPLGHAIASGGDDNSVILTNTLDGHVVHALSGHTGAVRSVVYSMNGATLASASDDGSVRLWNTSTGHEICAVYNFDNGDWAVVAPDGRFDTNDLDSGGQLHWVMSDEPFTALPIELFMRQYYTPQLLPRLLAGEKLPNVPDITKLYRSRPTIKIDPNVSADPADPNSVMVTVTATPAITTPPPGSSEAAMGIGNEAPKSNAIYDLRLFRDGQLVGYAPKTAEGGPVTIDSKTGSYSETFHVACRATAVNR